MTLMTDIATIAMTETATIIMIATARVATMPGIGIAMTGAIAGIKATAITSGVGTETVTTGGAMMPEAIGGMSAAGTAATIAVLDRAGNTTGEPLLIRAARGGTGRP